MIKPTCKTYEFTITLMDVEDVTEWIAHELIDGGCGDGRLSSSEGVVRIYFSRAATSLEEAIESAKHDVEQAGFAVERITFDETSL